MAYEDWERNPNGDIKVYPLAGYETFRPYGMYCGLRVRYLRNDSQLQDEEFQALPLVTTVDQARELARALNRVADAAEQPPSDEPRQ